MEVTYSQQGSLKLCSSPRIILGVIPLYESRDELLGFRCRTTSIPPARTCPEFCSCLHNAGLGGPFALFPRTQRSSQSPLLLCGAGEDGVSGASSLQSDALGGEILSKHPAELLCAVGAQAPSPGALSSYIFRWSQQ